ncbi:beta propeller repeat protein [Shewanella fidelis]|uniref:Uncharacterized protein n=1 Tax=Shewanella fidelis TaxID=173509 RepID=A0AAW8NNW4_9GAMM|nr:hypothetical protein [Shewanella fidelis]MDR8523841.1 hypothetical protein [Shewanella fidelis]MDW4810389.1 hypothetical protein [Shewanella fidelis]MDW4823723.1 hypothetical protein [Shewanella fidelis]
MIVNTEIKSGFATISRQGKYFSLISASGVLRVVLKLQGSVKLDTKMWVGMNIDAPINFDEIVLYGNDSPVEFWAGNVSMTSGRYASQAANAINTKTVMVNESTILTANDLTRTGVRVRPSKDIFLGGAGVNGGGWRVKAGETVEVPLAGLLSAFKSPAHIDYSDINDIGQVDNFWPSESAKGSCFVSEDERIRIIKKDDHMTELYSSSDSGLTWIVIRDNVRGYAYDTLTGRHIAYCGSSQNLNSYEVIYSDDGINWSTLSKGVVLAGSGSFTSNRCQIVAGQFQAVYSGWVFCCDIETGNAKSLIVESGGNSFNYGRFIDSELKVGFFSGWSSDGEIFKTIDGGNTWESIGHSSAFSSIHSSADGKNLFFISSDNSKPCLSNDYGNSWLKVDDGVAWSGVAPVAHVYKDIWVTQRGGEYKLVNNENGTGVVVTLGSKGVNMHASHLFFNSISGFLYGSKTASNGTNIKGINIKGDISPARVEVMELLS